MAPFPETPSDDNPRAWIAVLVLCALALVPLSLSTGLFDLDEGFYASVAREMARTGDTVTPRLAGAPFFEKPPLLYWAMAAFLKLGLPPVFAVRLPSILAALGTLLTVAWMSRRGHAWLAAAGLAFAPLFLGLGHLAFTDAPFTCFLTLTLCLFWLSVSDGRQALRMPAAACLGLATLTKGPAACVLFLLIAAATFVLQPQLRPGYRRYWPESVLVFVFVASPWYYLVYRAHGSEFFQEFILRQNLSRFAGGDLAHRGPIYLYIPVLLIGFFPWSLYLPWLAKRTRGDPFHRYCWTWAWVVFLLFSLSGTKLPSYILPLFPPLAMLLPMTSEEMWATDSPRRAWLAPLTLSLALCCFMVIAVFSAGSLTGPPAQVAGRLPYFGIALALAVIITSGGVRFLRPEVAHVGAPLVLSAALSLSAGFLILPAYYAAEQGDIHRLATRAKPEVAAGAPYTMYDMRPGKPSVMFLLGVHETPVRGPDDLLRRARRDRRFLVFTKEDGYRELYGLGFRARERAGEYVLMRYFGPDAPPE